MIFDEIPLGVVFQGADGAILSANPAAQRILGLSLDQMQGRTSLDLRWRAVHEDGSDFPGQDHPAMQALRSGQVIRDVVMGVYNPQLQDYVWLNVIATPAMRNPGEAPFQVMTTFEDITARKRAEENLAAANRQTAVILESISDAFYALDRQSCFTYVNQKAADLWHKQPADLLGKNIWEVFAGSTTTDAYRYIQQVLSDGQPARFESYSKFLGNWVEVHVYPTETGVSVYFQDITERKKTEEALAWSESKFRLIFDHAPYSFSLTQTDGTLIDVNPAWERLNGYSRAEAIGKTTTELGLFVSMEQRQEMFRLLQQDGKVRDFETVTRTRDDRELVVLTNVDPVVINEVRYYLSSNEDITELRRTERELQESLALSRSVFQSGAVARFYTRISDRVIVDMNAAAEIFLGYSREELIGKPVSELDLWVDPDERKRAMAILLEQGYLHNFEFAFKKKSGETGWAVANVEIIKSGAEKYQPDGEGYSLAEFVDITERKKIEKNNQQLARLYATLSQINQVVVRAKGRQELFDTICKVALDYGKFTMAWVGLYDTQSGQLTPVATTDTLPFEKIDVRQMPFREGLIGLALQSGQIMYSGDIQSDPRTAHWHENTRGSNYHAAAAIPLSLYGVVIGLLNLYSSEIGFFLPQTEQNLLEEIGLDIGYGLEMLDQEARRRQAEEEVAYLLNRLDLAVRAAHLGIWDWDIVANHLTWDEQMYQLYGLTPADFASAYESWLQGVHPEDRAYSDEISKQAQRGEKEYDTEFRVVWPDGSIHWLKALGQVIRSAEGSPIRMVGVNYDITAIKQAQAALEEVNQLLERRVAERTAALTLTNAELQRSSRSKDEFLSTMSHELRTPLNAILSLSESLQEGTYGELTSGQLGTLQTIYESGEHLLNLINDILDFSKAEAGSMDLQTEPVNIRDLVDSSLRLLNPQAMKKHLRIFTAMDSNLGTLTGDPRRLKQMLLNLLINAVKFTPENGQVGLEITRESEGETIRFTVWDNGIGIPAGQIARLFQPFVQLDSALSRQYTGTGLGLALVRRLAELHGGSVGVESQEGKGSRFWFILPVGQVVTSGPLEPQVEGSATFQSVSAPKRALVIEDSVVAADHIARYLRELNTEVSIRPTGLNIVETVLQVKPDVIILDILLPDISGWQVLEDLKTHPLTCGIPVIIISVVDERSRAAMLGVAAYLVKPVSREKLKEAILKAIAPSGQANHVLIIRHDEAILPLPIPSGAGAVILYAEDNRTNLQSFMDYLKVKGFQVIPALNGYEAIQRAQEFKPDLILMDIQMPAMDGLEAIRRLRATPDFAKTPIIALTALAMPGDRERCLAAGANAYLAKPVGLKRLLGEIEGLLSQ
jgi:PAS domain S-box-containing protein